MASFRPSASFLLSVAFLVVVLPCFAHAFGAGNIGSTSSVEGQNWRHGDIEDTLLTILMARSAGGKKFTKMDVKRVYFGNWLRDYSQAVDVGTVKSVSAEAIRIILWILGFMSFGYGTKEFEVTTERLGCYRPEEHIDNPKDYADNVDARQYDRRLRGPVDERRELSVDPRTGLKSYIASEDQGITTSAGLVRNLFGRSIDLGRNYARTGNKAELYEALRLLGTGCHCLEDFSAHSNYTELALRTLGEKDVFPHVGRHTSIHLQGVNHPVFPIVTGTFGGVDFFHSVMGELSDKATQSEVQDLEGTVTNTQNKENVSMVKELLKSLPSGLLGGNDQSSKVDQLEEQAAAQKLQNTHISPRQPEAWTKYLNDIAKEVYPILEFHDELMQSISSTIEKIPILPEMIEKFQDQINIFVFSLLAPYVLPVIKQCKAELQTGSSEVINSSRDKQLIVFNDDNSTNPTHSMLSKDHFSNVLNEPAGKVASQVLKWVVPQLMACWDDESMDIGRTINRIVTGVFHHPAMKDYGDDGARDGRQLMFSVVEQWWQGKSEHERAQLRDQLSRDGVEKGRNHKEGVHDQGHGCGKPLGMPNLNTAQSSGAIGGAVSSLMGGAAATALVSELAGGSSAFSGPGRHGASEHGISAVGSMLGMGGDGPSGGGRGGRGGRRPSPGRGGRAGRNPGENPEPAYQQGSPYAQQGGYRPDTHHEEHHHQKEDSDSESEYSKRAKKERKRLEKESEKQRKEEKKHDKHKHKKHSDDESDSDDSFDSGHRGRGDGSPHRGGGGGSPHRGGASPRRGGSGGRPSPGRGGEYNSYRQSEYTNPYVQQDHRHAGQVQDVAAMGVGRRPAGAGRMQGPGHMVEDMQEGVGTPEGMLGEAGVAIVDTEVEGTTEDDYRRLMRTGRRNDYEEGLAYGSSGGARRNEYDEGLAYGESGEYRRYTQPQYDAGSYAQPNQYQSSQEYSGSAGFNRPQELRNEYPIQQTYGGARYEGQGYSGGGAYGEAYQGGYERRGDGGYGPGEDQRYEQRDEYGQRRPEYRDDEYREDSYGNDDYDRDSYQRRY